MKKLFVIGVIMAMGASSSFAAGQPVEKPDLPGGYQNWPYKFSGTCQVEADNTLQISMFVTVNTAVKESEGVRLGIEEVQIVSKVMINGNPFITQYSAGDSENNEPTITRSYLYTKNGLMLFTDYSELDKAANKLLKEKLKKNTDEVLALCPKFVEEIKAFDRDLEEKTRK